jgi:hypothetical protein
MKVLFSAMVFVWCVISSVNAQVEVLYFISPTCPICKFYTLEMKEIARVYSDSDVVFKALAVGPLLSDSAVVAFQEEYAIPFPVLRDDSLHRVLNATVTPEVFVLQNQSVLYHGRIDDSYVRVGKRRAHVKNKELRDALDSVLKGDGSILNTYVPAIGCIIEK